MPFELRPLLQDALEPLELRARQKGLRLQLTLGGDVPLDVVGDPLRLRQIVVNLVGNAIKFTRVGAVVLNVSRLWRDEQEWLCASVSDSGVGIAHDKLERIFESFEQADLSTPREFGGSGLGLTISRRLAKLMQGRLWAESQVGVGSVFPVATVSIQNAVERHIIGTATGAMNFFRAPRQRMVSFGEPSACLSGSSSPGLIISRLSHLVERYSGEALSRETF